MSILSDEEFFKKLSEKTSESIEELKAQFAEALAEVKAEEKFAELTENQRYNIARNRFGVRKTRELSSNAIGWEGIVIGIGGLVDTVERQKKMTIAAYKADYQKTMKGWIYNDTLVLSNEDGVPLWPENEVNKKMNRARKPLPEHSWLRTLYLIARPIDPKTKQAGPAFPATMTLNDKFALDISNIPIMKPIKFKALNKTKDEDRKINEYRINHSAFTKFEPTKISDLPPIDQFLPQYTNHYESLGGLDVWHNNHEKDKNSWVITEGSVAILNLEPNQKTGNMYMIISDESLLFGGGDKTGVMCWIPTDRNIEVDFAVESRVLVIGRTTRGKAKDPITGDLLEDVPGDVMINVYGIFAPPLFKVSPEVKPLTEKSVTT